MSTIYQKAREFIFRNARPLDFARWQYHFENGSKEAVLKALACYQNKDGGFGHALEVDAWNPNTSPIQTWAATEILRELNFTDSSHPIFKGILSYLESGKDFDGKCWYNSVRSNNEYPHAPWWHTDTDTADQNNYNPTACLAGFIIRFAEGNSALYKLGCRIAKEAFQQLLVTDREQDMHTITCYIRLMQYIEEAGATDVIDLIALKSILSGLVHCCITQETDNWETGYICKPSQFFNDQSSMFYADNQDIAEFECDFLVKTQLKDGSWDITWDWEDYAPQWALSKNWWKSNGIILNLLYLRGFSKL